MSNQIEKTIIERFFQSIVVHELNEYNHIGGWFIYSVISVELSSLRNYTLIQAKTAIVWGS